MPFAKKKAGKWIQPVMSPSSYKFECCDCGLVHSIHYRVVFTKAGKPKVQFKVYRDELLTRQQRNKRAKAQSKGVK
jgi:hypothetical protein